MKNISEAQKIQAHALRTTDLRIQDCLATIARYNNNSCPDSFTFLKPSWLELEEKIREAVRQGSEKRTQKLCDEYVSKVNDYCSKWEKIFEVGELDTTLAELEYQPEHRFSGQLPGHESSDIEVLRLCLDLPETEGHFIAGYKAGIQRASIVAETIAHAYNTEINVLYSQIETLKEERDKGYGYDY